jgi:enoyl-CoA hydratase/carnithine racemase
LATVVPVGNIAVMPTLSREDDIWTLDLGDTENRFHPDWLVAAMAALGEIENADGPRGLVLSAHGKFFSNGLDLEWLMAHGDQLGEYVGSVQALLARVLALPVPSVAAIQGHCFAAGAMLALACDFRIMRADRGFFCLPEVDIKIPFSPGMSALIQGRLSPQVAHEAMTTGRRYGGADAERLAIVDAAVGESELHRTALEIISPLTGKAGPTLGTIKARMYGPALAALTGPDVALG